MDEQVEKIKALLKARLQSLPARTSVKKIMGELLKELLPHAPPLFTDLEVRFNPQTGAYDCTYKWTSHFEVWTTNIPPGSPQR